MTNKPVTKKWVAVEDQAVHTTKYRFTFNCMACDLESIRDEIYAYGDIIEEEVEVIA